MYFVAYLLSVHSCSISDAYNDARDKVRYLEALRQVFEQLQANQTPLAIVSNVLPSLAIAVKQMIGQSRVYARSGFLGFLFMKVSMCSYAVHAACVCVCVCACVHAKLIFVI